jgi:hypothetical protein
MKKLGKVLVVGTVIFMLAAGSAFSSDFDLGFDKLQKTVSGFSEAMAEALPFNSTMGLNWSDAHIGQLIGEFPPRFGIGLTFGATLIPMASINELLGLFGTELPIDINAGLPLPAYTVEGRIGGIVLPFDIGFKIGTLPSDNIVLESLTGVSLNYLLVGGDIRYSILPNKKSPLKVSVGLGFNHLSGGIATGLGLDFPELTIEGYTLTMSNPELGLRWKTNCLELKAQASFSGLKVITPYLGLGLNYSWSEAGYYVNSKPVMTGPDGAISNPAKFLEELNRLGITDMEITEEGINQIIKNEAFNMRAFGGFSLNMAVIRLDLTGMFDILTSSLGFSVGLRFQL